MNLLPPSARVSRGLSVAALTASLLTACAAPELPSAVTPIDAARLGLSDVPAQPVGEALAPWWDATGDPQLAALIQRALADNPSLQVAQTRWRQAQAAERQAQGADAPQLQATAESDRQHFSANGLYPPPLAGSTRTIGTAQLEGHWALDLFGLQRAELEAAIGQQRAAQADVQAARWWLSAQVAHSYVQLAHLQAQTEVARRNLAQRTEMLALIRQRVASGLDTDVELRQGEGAVPDVRGQITALEEQQALTRHALAVLTGQPPNTLDTLTAALPAWRLWPADSPMPLDLLARRADVMAARWRADAAGHQVAAAKALYYPNIDLRGHAGYNAIGLDQLLKPGSWQWGWMPAVHLPLFDGDRRQANLQGTVAQADAAVSSYNQVVLQAAQEVADQLQSAQSIARQQQDQASAQASAEAAYALAVQRYRAGLSTYLTVLSAEGAVLGQRRQAVDLLARAADTQVALTKALGGLAAQASATGAVRLPAQPRGQSQQPTQIQPQPQPPSAGVLAPNGDRS